VNVFHILARKCGRLCNAIHLLLLDAVTVQAWYRPQFCLSVTLMHRILSDECCLEHWTVDANTPHLPVTAVGPPSEV